MVKTATSEKQNNNTQQVSIFKRFFGQIQRIGKSLLFPIAMLPLAAIFLRMGAQMPSDTAFAKVTATIMNALGKSVFDNLPLVFAVGVAFGLSKDQRGEAAITALVVFTLMI